MSMLCDVFSVGSYRPLESSNSLQPHTINTAVFCRWLSGTFDLSLLSLMLLPLLKVFFFSLWSAVVPTTVGFNRKF